MALLDTLMIRGIRSIGVRDEDAYVIKFLNPLTIISGPNGTGKTTTIECLNYVTNGGLPAGKLNTFIHSVEIARTPRVDGMVKLSFIDAKKRKCVATKRVSSITKPGSLQKTTCKSDEFTLQITQLDGATHSVSSKVIDFNREMLNLFGVPAAILDSVIFCHQEDSCCEPKELKTRFDRIFQLTKFVKAMDQIKKLKKEQENEYKQLVLKQANAEQNVQQRVRYLLDKENCEIQRGEAQERLTQLKDTIDKTSEIQQNCSDRIIKLEKSDRQIELIKTQINSVQGQINVLKVPSYNGTEEDLKREIAKMKSTSEYISLEQDKEQLERSLKELDRQLNSLRNEKTRCEQELMQHMSGEMRRVDIQREVDSMQARFAQMFGIVSNSPMEIRLKLSDCKENTAGEQRAITASYRTQRAACQRELDKAQAEKSRIECEGRAAAEGAAKLAAEIMRTRTRLSEASSSQSELPDLMARIQSYEAQLASMGDGDEHMAQQLRDSRQLVQQQVDELRAQCETASKYEEVERETERLSAESAKLSGQYDEVLDKHEPDMRILFGTMPEGPWGAKVSEVLARSSAALASAESDAANAQRSADREKQTTRQLAAEEDRVIEEIRQLDEKIREDCDCAPNEISSLLADVRKQLAAYRKELAPLDTKAVLYESWSSEVQQKSCCPLCERRFASKNAVHELSNKLMNMSLSLPTETNRLQRLVEECEKRERVLAEAHVYAEQREKLEKESLADVRERKCSAQRKQLTESQNLQKRQADLQEAKKKSQRVNRIQEEVRELVSQNDQLQQSNTQRNLLTEKLHRLREQRISLGETAAQATTLEEQIRIKEAEREELLRREHQSREALPRVRNMIEEMCRQREALEKTMKDKDNVLSSTIREIDTQHARYSDLIANLGPLAKHKAEADNCRLMLEQFGQQVRACEDNKGRYEAKMLDNQSSHAKLSSLDDQMTKMGLERDILTLEAKLADVIAHAGEVETADVLRRKHEKANNAREKAELESARLNGQLDQIGKTYREAVAMLRKKDLAEAERIYRDVLVDKIVCQNTIADLTKYGECLDTSVLQFHSEKMAAINEILDDLWRKVYKGGDIESIKIRSEHPQAGDRRKSYDYRVVMLVEGGIELDMRERCSAGQRMLACILIRVALADVFGGMCSIITLDEPTTNLDSLKIEHLAEMLNDLIAARRTDDNLGGRQFQMIVITHDERLVEKLTMGSRPDHIYVMAKDDRGLTFVRRQLPDGELQSTK